MKLYRLLVLLDALSISLVYWVAAVIVQIAVLPFLGLDPGSETMMATGAAVVGALALWTGAARRFLAAMRSGKYPP